MSITSLKAISAALQGAALAAADPRKAVERNLSVTERGFRACGREHAPSGKILLLAVGKASLSMAGAALGILGSRISKGLVVAPHGYRLDAIRDARVSVLEAAHPLPDEAGLSAAQRARAMICAMAEGDLCLFLLSGGGSSLLPLPRMPITLPEKTRTTSLLLASGADIREINTVRKHLSAI